VLISPTLVLLEPTEKLTSIHGKRLKIPEFPQALEVTVMNFEDWIFEAEIARDDRGKRLAWCMTPLGPHTTFSDRIFLTEDAVSLAAENHDPNLQFDFSIEE